MDPSFTEKFITTKDAGEFSGYSSDYLSRLVRSKKIIGKRIGRNWIIDKESLTRFLDTQGNYKIDRARELASVRAQEYRAHRSLLHRVTKSLTAQISVPEKFCIASSSLSSHVAAFATALVVIVFGVFAAQVAVIPQLAHDAAFLAHETASGFNAAFGGIPANIASRIDAADSAMRSVSPKLQKANAIEFANSRATSLAKITNPDFSSLRMTIDTASLDTRVIALIPTTLVEEPMITVADVQTIAPTLRSVSEIGLDAISFLVSPSRMTSAFKNTYIGMGRNAYDGITASFASYDSLIKHSGARALAVAATMRDALARTPDLISKVNLAFGTSIIAASHAAIQADVAASYWTAATAPASASATVAIIGTTGDALARATAGAAQEAPVFVARTLRSLSDMGPALAQAVFGVEYAAATRFVAITGSVTRGYASALNSLGEVGYESARGTRHTIQLAAVLPDALHDAYLGALGKSARALDGLGITGSAFDAAKHTPLLAAALSGLSLGEQAALATYETIRGFFDSMNRSLVAFFTTTPSLVLPNGVPKPRVITIATSTKPATPYNLQPTISTSYPTYTTVVQGISADVLSRSLASLRTEMFDTIAAQIRPVSNQVAQNATTIQYVNMIQDLSNLIVRNGDFRGGSLTNGVSVSATTGNFTNLTGATASLGTTAITGDLSVSGTITFPSIISALSSVSAPYFTATSSTATSTFAGSLAIDTNGFVYATSTKNVGIGVLSPAALLAIQNSTSTQPIFVAKNAAGTEVYRLTDAGFVGIGTTSPTYALSVEGSSSLGNQAIAGYFTATSSVATSIFSGSLAIGTSSPFGNGLLTVGTSSPLLHIDSTTGNIGIGTSSPSQFLSVAGNGYFTGGLGVGTSTTTPGDLRIAGNAYVGGSLTVVGNNTILGNSTSNTLTINSSITSSIVPNQNATYNLGSPSYYWNNAYVGTLTANNISAASTTIGGTQSNTFTINSDNATADTEDMSLVFFRGSVVPNAILAWNSAGSAKRFEFNQPLHIQNASASTTQSTFTIQGVAGQTADIFSAASSSGANLFNLTSAGRIGVGTSSPAVAFDLYATDALRVPVGTTVQRPSVGDVGYVRYNVTTHQFEGYGDNAVWQGLGGVINPAQTTYITAGADDYLRFFTTSGERMTITNTGNIGIGTTSPAFKLDVNGIVNATALYVNGTPYIGSQWTTSGSNIYYTTGNIGIGTTTPFAALQVATTTGKNLVLSDSGAGANLKHWLFSSLGGSLYVGTTTDAYATSSPPAFTITNSGNVGIGTTTPWGQLSVNPSGITGPSFVIGSSTATNFIVTNGGNVGIGTTSPAFKLDVNGIVNATALYVNGTPYIGSQWTTSGSNIYYTTGNIGIGTTTPFAALQVATTTGKNLVLSDSGAGANLKHWLFSSLGGSLYVGTTTDAYATSSPPAFTITNSGNVGIGTTSPTLATLAVSAPVASIMLNSTTAGSGPGWGLVANNGSSMLLIRDYSAGAGYRMAIDGSGNVGIGTTTPNGKLEVSGGAIINQGTSNTAGFGTWAAINAAYQFGSSYWGIREGITTHAFNIDVGNGGTPLTSLSILQNGNVGIGTTNPRTKLEVQGPDDGTLQIRMHGTSAPSYYWEIGRESASTGDFRLNEVRADGAASTKLAVQASTGNVGIGTTAPSLKLHIVGTGGLPAASGSTPNGSIVTEGGTNSVLFIGNDSSSPFSAWLQVSNKTNLATNYPLLLNPNGGNVGIGTTDPSAQKLVVVGNIRSGASGTLGCLENFAGTGLVGTCSSDSALKTVVGNVGSVLDKLASLDLVTYHWNQTAVDQYHKSPDALNTGYLAQQVQAQFPELVSIDEKGFEQLNYTTLGLYGLQAIKELYAQIEPLTAVLSVVPGVESQCVVGDTRLRRRKRVGSSADIDDDFDEVAITDIVVGDEIQSLDERTGRVVYSRVNALIDMGEQEVYELVTKSGRKIRTTANHPFLAREGATKS